VLRGRRTQGWAAVALLLPLLAAGAGAATAQPSDEQDEVSQLRAELAALRGEYEARIAALEERLRSLESGASGAGTEGRSAVEGQTGTPAPAPGGLDLEALREAARQAAAATPVEEARPAVASSAGNLNRLNPEISFTGDVIGVGGDNGEDFEGREFELDLQSALDPYSRTRLTLAFSPDEGVDIEEGWILYNGLPGGLSLKGGKFRQRFGALNQQHRHALPQRDYPLALSTYFDAEGLAQTGIALSWLLPHPWASANEVIVEVTDGSSAAFGGEDFARLVVLGRLQNYWDLGTATYLEWGLSGISGRPSGALASDVLGSDLTLHWQPPNRAKYREVTWRTEVLQSRRDDGTGVRVEARGGYSYLEALVRRDLYAGVRYDRVENPLDPDLVTTGWFPSLTWWQSEYVRLRAEYGMVDVGDADTTDEFTFQITWAAGPHKHETY
jgi:hypothetical protein